ncbi:MAG TPA: single-stranded DNA-binding protein [Candidatus Deferrimicrobium sp.]|nr:single-stranded DNA-binding protein [Candidatus Deferrimicrobium sp.]
MINRVTLVGHLTRDAESTSGPSTTLTRMRLATNSVWRDGDGNRQESAEFHSVVAFGKLGEICAAYCLKGRRVYIEGRLRTREFDGSDGLRRYSTEIVAETMKLLDRPRTGDASVNDVEPADGGHEAELVALEGGAHKAAQASRGTAPVASR